MPGLASLLSRRTMNPRAGGAARRRELLRRRGTPPPMWDAQGNPWPSGQSLGTRIGGPPGGKHGGQVVGYQGGGRTMNPRAVAAAARRRIGPPLSQGLYPSGDPYASPIPPPWGGRVPPGGG